MIKLSEFIERSNKAHNHFYDYELSVFIGGKRKIQIICPSHGSFWQIAANHMRGDRCSDCTGNKKLTNESFIKRANIIHNNKYDYSKINVINNSSEVKIICQIHGMFKQKPAKHLLNHGCQICGKISSASNQKSSTDEFIKRANIIHNKYNYDLVVYKDAKTKVEIKCLKHGTFFQTPDSHLRGAGCKHCYCNTSKSEIAWLDSLNIKKEYRNFLIYIGSKRINVDGFDPLTNTIYEFNGDYWHGNPDIYNANDLNKMNKRTFGDLYNCTIKRQDLIKSAGYNLISIWENDFNG